MKSELKNEKRILIILSLITFFINVAFIFESKMVYVVGDEMGPISIAAYFAGQDWSSAVQYLGYYSYGYSFLLYPLFLVTDTAVGFYRLVIVSNAMLVALIVPISYSIGKKICPYTKQENLYIASFAAANFVANIERSQSAWCEVLLIFLYWCIVLNFVMLENKINYKRVIAGACLSMYSYMVHQRTIGIVVACAMFFLVLCIVKKYRMRYAVCYYGVDAVLLWVHGNIKTNIQANVWSNSTVLQNNDYGGVIGNIIGSLHAQSFISYLKQLGYAIFGHFFHICVATMGIALIAILFLAKKNGRAIKTIVKREMFYEKINITYMFILFSFMFTLVISVLFLTPDSWNSYTRSDPLVYGRYVETVLGVFIYIGVVCFLEKCENKKGLILLYGLLFVITFVTANGYGYIEDLPFNILTCAGLSIFVGAGKINCWWLMLIVCAVITLLYLDHDRKRKIIYVGAVSIFWILSGYLYLYQHIIPSEDGYYQLSKLVENKWEMNEEADFYYYGEDGSTDHYQALCLQFLLKDRQNLIYTTDCSNVPDKVFYGVTNDLPLLFAHDSWSVVGYADGEFLFTNEFTNEVHSSQGVWLPNSMFHSGIDTERDEDAVFSSHGTEGYLMYGPYFSLEEGNYRVAVNYSTGKNEDALAGYAEVYSGTAQKVYTQQELVVTDGETNTIYLDFSLEELTSGLEIRAYTYGGQLVFIDKVTINKMD